MYQHGAIEDTGNITVVPTTNDLTMKGHILNTHNMMTNNFLKITFASTEVKRQLSDFIDRKKSEAK